PPPAGVLLRLLQINGSLALIALSYLLMEFKAALSPSMVTQVALGLLGVGIGICSLELVIGHRRAGGGDPPVRPARGGHPPPPPGRAHTGGRPRLPAAGARARVP